MDGDFYVAASLATTLTKVALRYVAIVQDKKKQNVSFPAFLKQNRNPSDNFHFLISHHLPPHTPRSPLLQRPC